MKRTSQALIDDPVGRFPQATVACFDPTRGELPRRRLDVPRTRQYLSRLAAAGAESLLIASSTGQGHLRTVGELAEWFECAAEAEIGTSMLVALLRPEDGMAANTRLLDLLAERGYAAVFFRPGTNLPADAPDTVVTAQLAPLVALAAERDLAVGLYSISAVSGLPLTPGAVAGVLSSAAGGENVVAVKVTEPDYEASTRRFLADERLSRLKIVQGWDPHLGRALREGSSHDVSGRQRAGVTSGLMALAPQQYLHLLEAANAGDWAEVEACQDALDRLFAAMQDEPGQFADLQRAKAVMGLGQPVLGRVTEAQCRRVIESLQVVPRTADRRRLAAGLDLMGDGPYHDVLRDWAHAREQTC